MSALTFASRNLESVLELTDITEPLVEYLVGHPMVFPAAGLRDNRHLPLRGISVRIIDECSGSEERCNGGWVEKQFKLRFTCLSPR